MSLTHTLAVLAVLFGGLVAAAAPSQDAQVRTTVESHFQAIAKADRAALEKSWATDVARITTIDAKQQVNSKPIAKAFDLWTKKATPNMTYTIESVDLIGDQMATVKATVNWQSGVYRDYLTLMKIDGRWQLTAKHYVADLSVPIFGGYGAN